MSIADITAGEQSATPATDEDVQGTAEAQDNLAPEEAERVQELSEKLDGLGEERKRCEQRFGAAMYASLGDASSLGAEDAEAYRALAAVHADEDQCRDEIEAIRRNAAERAAHSEVEKLVIAEDGSFECPFCGNRIMAENRFCAGCGKPAQEARDEALARAAAALEEDGTDSEDAVQKDQKVCPSCGATVRAADAFCIYCGARL